MTEREPLRGDYYHMCGCQLHMCRCRLAERSAGAAPIDVEALTRAIQVVADDEGYALEFAAECRRLAVDVAAEYARLSVGTDR